MIDKPDYFIIQRAEKTVNEKLKKNKIQFVFQYSMFKAKQS